MDFTKPGRNDHYSDLYLTCINRVGMLHRSQELEIDVHNEQFKNIHLRNYNSLGTQFCCVALTGCVLPNYIWYEHTFKIGHALGLCLVHGLIMESLLSTRLP